jgi:hypothetical protein
MKGPAGKRPQRVPAVRLIPSHPAPEPLSLSKPTPSRRLSQHRDLGHLTPTPLAFTRLTPPRPVRFDGLRPFLRTLEEAGELHRVTVPVSARFEIAEIASRAAALDSPALLFEKVDGYPFPVVANLLAGRERIRLALGREPETIGLELMLAAERLQPPTIGAIWETRSLFRRAFTAKVTTVDTGRCHDVVADPDLDRLPILTCWPQDGGPFITWPMVLTQHPVTGGRNLGTYRMQVFDRRTTGLHMQIQKGGAFHYREAEARGQSLAACCILGGDPSLLLASVALMGVGSLLFTNLVATSDAWVIRSWQFILGIGIGPTLAVFTIVIQNAVPFSKLGVATSNLTFFRQIGGTVGLSIAGSLFGSQVADRIPVRLLANGIPQQSVELFKSAGFDQNNLVSVGTTLGQQILAGIPAGVRPSVEPFIPKIVTSIYEAISLAIGSVFWLGVAASVLAFLAVLVIRELPLRSSLGPARGETRGANAPGQPGAEGRVHQPGLVGGQPPR